ncbi:MAG: DNA polymerase III subunit delta [Acidaminococcaceae bacterium]|nr:DNA polymerase III subunit delta [Acidaminococcaceae bacterium]
MHAIVIVIRRNIFKGACNVMLIAAEKFIAALSSGERNAPNLTIAFGDEAYYKDSILQGLTSEIFAGVSEQDRSLLTFEQEVNFSALREGINTYPFFSGKNFIIIKDPKLLDKEKKGEDGTSDKRKKDLQEFTEILADIPEYTHVICLCGKIDKRLVFYKTISKIATLVECNSIKSYSLKPWLEEQAASFGSRFEYQAIALIMEYMSVAENVPLLFLHQEIEKLALYAGKRKIWTVHDVTDIFSQLPEVSGFALGNAISDRKIAKVLELLAIEQKKGSGNFIPTLSRVSFEIRRLCKVRELIDAGEQKDMIAARLKMHPYAAQLLAATCQKFTLKALKCCLLSLTMINMNMRKGGRQWECLEEALLKLFATTRK